MSVVSVPSMMKRFSAALAPSMEMPPDLGSWLAPGAWVTRVVKSRPLGSFAICSSRRFVERPLCLTSMSGASPTICTTSAIAPTESVRFTCSVWPSAMLTPLTFAGRKPGRLAVTSQEPGATLGNRYAPLVLVTVVSTAPAALRISTIAPGAGAVLWSTTVPSSVALCSCASAGRPRQSVASRTPKSLDRISPSLAARPDGRKWPRPTQNHRRTSHLRPSRPGRLIQSVVLWWDSIKKLNGFPAKSSVPAGVCRGSSPPRGGGPTASATGERGRRDAAPRGRRAHRRSRTAARYRPGLQPAGRARAARRGGRRRAWR